MSVLFILFVIYLIGAVLSYGRFYAEFGDRGAANGFALASWIGIFVGSLNWDDGNWVQFRDPKKLKAKRKAHKKALKAAFEEDEPYQHSFETNPPDTYSWSK